jgi:alpha-mannosidase
MHDNNSLVKARVERFLRERIVPAIYRSSSPLAIEAWAAPGEPVSFTDAAAARYAPFAVGDAWGAPWSTTWFRVRGRVPTEWLTEFGTLPEGTRAELLVDLGFTAGQSGFQAEGLLYRADGTIIKAISPFNAASSQAVADNGDIDVVVEAAGNPDIASNWTFAPTPLGDRATAGDAALYVLRRMDVALMDLTVWELAQDVRVLLGLLYELPRELPRRANILRALEAMTNAMDPDDVAGTAAAGRAALAAVLAAPASASAHQLYAVGHAHIDSAWLWPVRETIRKCARTFSNVIALMDEDPTFTFACSSAQQFAWMKQFYPQLFERIKEKVAAGQFIPVGGMWVESDTNLPGSEALARQFVAGQGFFLEEFGAESKEVWLPDSFGYSGALPQIMRAAGARWFLTQKISWNETNVLPHHTFEWEGIDGTRIFTHFPPVDKYNSDLSAADLHHAERNYSDHGASTMSLLPYGYGDGGGGPTREMIATVERTRSLEGSPKVVQSTPSEFFEASEREYGTPPVWLGELYLEFHRGTYTSQLATKQGNRRSEHLLREAELWATTAAVRTEFAYPYDDLTEIWRIVLLQQFHDILPGSSLAWVHRDAERNYNAIRPRLEKIIDSALRALAGTGTHELAFNSAPHRGSDIAAMAGALAPVPNRAATAMRDGDGFVLENEFIRARLDHRGLLTSLFDRRARRETVAPGLVGNLFQLHRDTPNQWDAWDIDRHYRDNSVDLVDVDSIELGDDNQSVRITRSFGASSLVEMVRLGPNETALDLQFEIDWHERQKLLKLAFPLDIHAEQFASEIQFGHIQRPTFTNTSWDYARFETCAHRWIRVAEPDYGVAILNDSTYGHDVRRAERRGGGSITVARLSILRAARFPDPEQDQGHHSLRVAVLVGSTVQETVAGGYHLNLPIRLLPGTAGTDVPALITSSESGVVIEAVKLAEDGSGDVVVRAYESTGRHSETAIAASFECTAVALTDLLERPVADAPEIDLADGGFLLKLRPFQITTIRFTRPRS